MRSVITGEDRGDIHLFGLPVRALVFPVLTEGRECAEAEIECAAFEEMQLGIQSRLFWPDAQACDTLFDFFEEQRDDFVETICADIVAQRVEPCPVNHAIPHAGQDRRQRLTKPVPRHAGNHAF